MRSALNLARRLAFGGPAFRAYLATAVQVHDARPAGECPCCGYRGRFRLEPHLQMAETCPQCGALERQRLLALAIARGFIDFAGGEVLQFAPDPAVTAAIERQRPERHVTADFAPGRAELELNIEALALPDASFDRIVCSHVLEHVDDARALGELFRVLRPGGQVAIMVPIVEGWPETYENPAVAGADQRTLHFGQWDHVRVYGADLRVRIASAGFRLDEFAASGSDAATHRLLRGERVFRATRPLAG